MWVQMNGGQQWLKETVCNEDRSLRVRTENS